MDKDILNPETLAKQDVLTPEQEQAIQDNAFDIKKKKPDEEQEEIEVKIKEGEEENAPDIGKTDEEILQAKEEELSEEQKTRRGELVKEQEEANEKLLSTEDKDLDDAEKHRKGVLLKEKETQETEAKEAQIKEYAEKAKISVEDASKEIESINKISEKYGSDSFQLAKANLHLQQREEKIRLELKAFKEAPQKTKVAVEQVKTLIEEQGFIVKGKAYLKADIIEGFRADQPTLTENMEDDTVYALACQKITDVHNASLEKNAKDVVGNAKEKRAKALVDLSNYDTKFHDLAKELIVNLSDGYIASNDFSLEDVITQVQGIRYKEDLKAEHEKGFKAGEEKVKILGEKPPVGKGSAAPKAKTVVILNEKQKQRALEMFDGAEMTEIDKFKAYVRLHPEEFKKKKQDK